MTTTKAIVVSKIKYGDSSLIVKCFAEAFGMQAFILKGILSNKRSKLKPAYFQLLTLLEIVTNAKENKPLSYIKQASVLNPYHHIRTDFYKQSIAIFLSEIIALSLQNESANKPLFSFLEKTFQELNNQPKVANIHLLCMLGISKYLGFYPAIKNSDFKYFDLQEAVFTNTQPQQYFVFGEELNCFKKLLGIDFDNYQLLKLTKTERNRLLELMISYFQLHLSWFKNPKSLSVLKEIF